MIARRKPIKRGKPPKRSGRIKPKKRSAREFARIYGSMERVEWVSGLPCFVCQRLPYGHTVVVNAHVVTGGTSYKADYTTIIPLCSNAWGEGCHDRQHQHGWDVLPSLRTIDQRMAAARRIGRAWLASLPPLEASRP